jgi:hypothetical protein
MPWLKDTLMGAPNWSTQRIVTSVFKRDCIEEPSSFRRKSAWGTIPMSLYLFQLFIPFKLDDMNFLTYILLKHPCNLIYELIIDR